MTSATISQASAAGMEPLNESIAITIFIRPLCFVVSNFIGTGDSELDYILGGGYVMYFEGRLAGFKDGEGLVADSVLVAGVSPVTAKIIFFPCGMAEYVVQGLMRYPLAVQRRTAKMQSS
jgi:hypothetical protein